jgi:hypothetical protein
LILNQGEEKKLWEGNAAVFGEEKKKKKLAIEMANIEQIGERGSNI